MPLLPIFFDGTQNDPRILVKVRNTGVKRSLFLTFNVIQR